MRKTSYVRDANDRVLSRTVSSGVLSETEGFEYDAFGRLSLETAPDGVATRRLKEDTFGDYFDRHYFNVAYPNQFEVGVMFFKGLEELFFAVGEDSGGVYLTPRVYRTHFDPGFDGACG